VTLRQWIICSPLRSFSKSSTENKGSTFLCNVGDKSHTEQASEIQKTEKLISENVYDNYHIGLNYIKYFDENNFLLLKSFIL
jgi:hypothetical protein